ncbi:MAG: PQQ-binding-like beta-propeller repeat protein, partial [Propionibacteriales bacterium]|nr:PQQ-binding-like beta-propeller repeat protein [Propionibacteriales bacterium]
FSAADGRFALDLAEGEYVLRVTANGHGLYREEIVVDGPETVDVDLQPLTVARDDGWRQYQNNPARIGVSTDPLSAETLRAAWQTQAGSPVVFSSPVIEDGRAYVGTDSGQLLALDVETGERLWSFGTSEALRGAPAVGDGMVFVGGGVAGGIHALDAETGAERWSHPTPDRLTVYTQPALVGDALYAVTGPTDDASDQVIAFDAATGAVKWTRDVGASVFAGPTVGDGHLLVASADDARLVALDPVTGLEQWSLERSEHDDSFIGGASISDGVAYITTTHENGADGSVLAIDVTSGELLWEDKDAGDGQGSTPAVYGDVVISGSHSLGVVVARDRASGKAVWRHSESGPISSSLLVSGDGYVVAGSQLDNSVFALDAATGQVVWEEHLGANVTTSAAYDEGTLVTADTRGLIRAFEPTGTVRGTVTGPDGPVAATVRLVGTDNSVETDPETGAYRIDHKPGTFRVEVSAYGLLQDGADVAIVAGRTQTSDFGLTAVGSGSLTGVVRAESGELLPGASVTVLGTPLEPATTGADGTYSFPVVAAGDYQVEVTLAGHETRRAEVTIAEGGQATADVTLLRFQVAVVGDYQGRMVAELTRLGYRTEASTYADLTARPDDYEVVVANGGNDDPGATVLGDFITATDAAGTSVVWLDQWSIGWGAISHLSKHFGDPASTPDSFSSSGRVSLVPTVEHPLTEGLPSGERAQVLVPGHEWSAFEGYSGRTVADVHTDDDQTVGGGIGYLPRGTGSVHVLLASLAAAPWGNPETEWLESAHTVLGNAVEYALVAEFGQVSGTVTDAADAGLPATVTDVATGDQTTAAADGTYRLLLTPGEHTLRFTHPGTTAVERTVDVVAGETDTVDVTLAAAGAGVVDGTVVDADGAAVAGAEVRLVDTDHIATTGTDGSYSIVDVPAATYTLRVTATGFGSASQDVEVVAGQSTSVDVTLRKAARVAVVGDFHDQISGLLQEAEMVAEPLAWTEVDRVDEFDVVVFNDPTDPGAETFGAWLDALDAAQVSGVFA